MILNDNIRFIIYTYYTYTDKMIEEFRNEWKNNIKKVNRLFTPNINDMYCLCFICNDADHFNMECPEYYNCIHIINSLKTTCTK